MHDFVETWSSFASSSQFYAKLLLVDYWHLYMYWCNITLITHAGIAADVGRVFGRICLFVCLLVRALTGERLELSTPNLVHVYYIAVVRHALTQRQRSKGQRSRSHGYENRHGRTVASCYWPCPVFRIPVHRCATYVRCQRGSACWYDCLSS